MKTLGRNVPLLAICQSLMMSANSLIIASSALVGAAIAPDKALATLPLAAQFIAIMLTSIPAAIMMAKIGRKQGFMLSTLLGISGGVVTTYAILNQNFWLFLSGTVLVGMFNGFANYYRFAAADSVSQSLKGKAISYVMIGGVVAAIVGPNLANHAKDWLGSAQFAGSYASIIVLYLLSLLTLSFLKLPHHSPDEEKIEERAPRSTKEIIKQPTFVVALVCAMLGYGVMSFLMTATPLAMDHSHHHFDDTAFVIQWHVLGMFAPSFFTGSLIQRFGVLQIMLTGTILGFACAVINLFGTTVPHFWFALVLLGISWNFMFIGATTLLTETYHDNERARAQAINDFSVFTTVAMASLSAGALQHHFGWEVVNLGSLPFLAVAAAMIVWLQVSGKRVSVHATA